MAMHRCIPVLTSTLVTERYRAPIALWALRILAAFARGRAFRSVMQSVDESTLVKLQLIKADEADAMSLVLKLQHVKADDAPAKSLVRRRIRTTLARHERRGAPLADPLAANLRRLAETLELDELESRILAFTVLAQLDTAIAEVAKAVGEELDGESAVRLVATAIAAPPEAVHRALRADATLARSGLLRIDRDGLYGMRQKFDLLGGLPDALLDSHANPMELLGRFFHTAPEATLGDDDYPHLKDDLALLTRYLDAAIECHDAGVNVLIHGRPGTGKTELARVLARSTGRALYEIGMADESGEPVAGPARFSAYQLCQAVLARRHDCLVLFDEIEDVFPNGMQGFFALFGGGRSPDGQRKAWVNQVLEGNPVPALWVCNAIDAIDPAHRRRFDYVLELRTPPRSVRRRILERHLEALPVRPRFIERMAAHPRLQPAQVERAARVVRRIGDTDSEGVESTLERVLGNSLEALGEPRRSPHHAASVCAYDLAFVHADREVETLAIGLARHPVARLCLYGPPGTGKTAFARHLAERLDRPLIARRASELLSKWIGETEQHIAAMFREAEDEGAVLLLDEADSLLRERKGAYQSWEVTQVNELLVQMEAFEGIFIAATNLAEVLDAASLRRFDLKVRFDYLTTAQAAALLARVLAEHGVDAPVDDAIGRRLAVLERLAPGDFATVVRQARVLGGTLDAETLVDRLRQECAVKTAHEGRAIGFAAAI